MTKRSKIKKLIKELREFDFNVLKKDVGEDGEYMNRLRFWKFIKLRIQTITGNSDVPCLEWDKGYTDEAGRLLYIEYLEKQLFIDIDWNKLITLLATIATLASAIVAIILALKA